MDLRNNTWAGDLSVQSDGLAVTNRNNASSTGNVEAVQFYVVKEGNREMSARFNNYSLASAELSRLLTENVAYVGALRIAVIDRFGNELLRG